ncbi:hypothetical protein WN944_022497 [Citrus x changshan-huyou]|uniref:Uncharacterized protein n=1 Tax=Citrus x changshan-huyou TaxID=2935761 RepID=A0AAP0N4L6_9ROSI
MLQRSINLIFVENQTGGNSLNGRMKPLRMLFSPVSSHSEWTNVDSSRDTLFFEGAAPLSESRKRSLALTRVLLALFSAMTPNNWIAFKFTYKWFTPWGEVPVRADVSIYWLLH